MRKKTELLPLVHNLVTDLPRYERDNPKYRAVRFLLSRQVRSPMPIIDFVRELCTILESISRVANIFKEVSIAILLMSNARFDWFVTAIRVSML